MKALDHLAAIERALPQGWTERNSERYYQLEQAVRAGIGEIRQALVARTLTDAEAESRGPARREPSQAEISTYLAEHPTATMHEAKQALATRGAP